MRMWWLVACLPFLLGAAPVRDNTYIGGTVIQPADVMANENTIYTYLQNGVDTYANNSVTTSALQNNAVTSAKIADGTITTADLAFTLTSGNILPSGAVFFMLTGSCPAWTTDVSATYSNLFLRVNATAGVQSGSNTHTHTAGTFAGAAHTHSVPYSGWDNSGSDTDTTKIAMGKAGEAYVRATTTNTTGSGGGGAVTGISDSANNIPQYVSAKLCQVN